MYSVTTLAGMLFVSSVFLVARKLWHLLVEKNPFLHDCKLLALCCHVGATVPGCIMPSEQCHLLYRGMATLRLLWPSWKNKFGGHLHVVLN